MISINNVSKFYGQKTLFENVSFTINKGETIGLIGPNGAGKSTLFHMILGEVEPTSGSLHINKNIRIGYLPQESSFSSTHTVLQEIIEGDPTTQQFKKEKEELERTHESHSHRYAQIMHELEVLGFFELEHRGKAILSGLGFKEKDFNRPILELSGGWQMRVLLAKLLTCSYDFLMLDEPTNYLDLNAALWLKDFLSNYKGAFIIISHDKAFLNEVTQLTFILEHGTISRIKGNYEQYKLIRQEQRGYLVKQFREQEKIREQYQRFIDRFHAQPNKASQVRAKRKMLERLPVITVPPDPRESIGTFKFPLTQTSGYRVARLENISKSYPGGIEVYKNFDFEITKGEKAVLVGENGAGKSTLLKILAGVAEIDSGSRIIGHNVSLGYFSQTRMDVLSPERSVLDEAYGSAGGDLSIEAIRTLLAIFLFTGDDVEKKVSVLSGGEKSRLILAKLLLNPPNCLLLDEPTTHLDVDAVDALIQALNRYEGTIVCISHDIHFVRSVANAVFEVKDGTVSKFPGNFDYYLHKKAQDEKRTGTEPVASTEAQRESVAPKCEEPLVLTGEQKDFHKLQLSKQIKKLRKQKDKCELERNAKMRILENPRHGEEIIRYYTLLVKDLDSRIAELDHEIIGLKARFL